MPLSGFDSLCQERQKIIVSSQKKRKHTAYNTFGACVCHYQIDGVVLTGTERKACDYLLMNEDAFSVYLIELKGCHLTEAAEQLEATERRLSTELSGYRKFFRIIASHINVHAVRHSTFRRFQHQWRDSLRFESGHLEETI